MDTLTANRAQQSDHRADEHWSRRAFCAVDPDAWNIDGTARWGSRIGEARHGCRVHCPVLEQCKAAAFEVRGAVVAGTYYKDDGRVSDWQPAAASCRHCRSGGV